MAKVFEDSKTFVDMKLRSVEVFLIANLTEVFLIFYVDPNFFFKSFILGKVKLSKDELRRNRTEKRNRERGFRVKCYIKVLKASITH